VRRRTVRGAELAVLGIADGLQIRIMDRWVSSESIDILVNACYRHVPPLTAARRLTYALPRHAAKHSAEQTTHATNADCHTMFVLTGCILQIMAVSE